MTPSRSVSLSLRSLVPVTISVLAYLLASGCGGVSAGGPTSEPRVKPGGSCTVNGRSAPAEDGCNTCTCTSGTWACTEKACATSDSGAPSRCAPGTTRPADDGCNTCTCLDGSFACTERACPPPGATCKDGDTKKESCNTCTCAGGSWACSKRACPAPVCNDGDTKLESCNTCTCAGGSWACTDKACPPDQCKDGQTMFDGCNNCSCSGGQWGCTLRYCPPAAQDGGSAHQGCGGRLGDACGANEYCAYREGALCGAADASATCMPRPTACDATYAPVCGCDGNTYDNECAAAMKRTGVLHKGVCTG